MKPLILYGASYPDTVKLIQRIAGRNPEYVIAGFLDDVFEGSAFMGYPLLGNNSVLQALSMDAYAFVNNVFGTTTGRRTVAERIAGAGGRIVSLIDPDIDLAFTEIGEGTVLMKGVQCGANVKMGIGCAVRMNALINHDNSLGDYVFVGPGATLCGHVTIEAGAYLGAGCVIRERVRIGANAMIAAGAVVVHDVPPGVTVAGVPARQI